MEAILGALPKSGAAKGLHLTKVPMLDNEVSRRGWSNEQRTAILKEMNRVSSHPTFKSSKRCIELLRYLIDRALDGKEDGIKERVLGIEVFGRDANYDTNSDPIVRRTANEIRKRLGQCYFEPHSQSSVRIHMSRGNYLLEFEFEGDGRLSDSIKTENFDAGDSTPTRPESSDVLLDLVETDTAEEPAEPLHLPRPGSVYAEQTSKSTSKVPPRSWVLGIAAALLVSIACFFLFRSGASSSPEYKLWKPLLDSSDQITVCVSDVTPQVGDGMAGSQPPSVSPLSHGTPQKAPFLDTLVAQEISTRLLEYKRQANLQPASALTFQDFRHQPTVLIGGTINPWASMLLSKLRYTLRIDPVTLDKWIEDAQNSSMRDWKINGKPQTSDTFVDYGVLTRFYDRDTGQWIMALSGLEAHGTEAAGKLLADPSFAKLIPSNVGSTGNFQIVLKVPVMRGSTGPFEVLTVYTW